MLQNNFIFCNWFCKKKLSECNLTHLSIKTNKNVRFNSKSVLNETLNICQLIL